MNIGVAMSSSGASGTLPWTVYLVHKKRRSAICLEDCTDEVMDSFLETGFEEVCQADFELLVEQWKEKRHGR